MLLLIQILMIIYIKYHNIQWYELSAKKTKNSGSTTVYIISKQELFIKTV